MRLRASCLDDQKRLFRENVEKHDEIQWDGWQEKAWKDATAVAARRAHLYRPGINFRQRYYEVREPWGEELLRLADRYAKGEKPLTKDHFESDISDLKVFMNDNYNRYFYEKEQNRYASGFRIAHAQKSLSLILKHYWCNNMLGRPPCCPVDSVVLTTAGDLRTRWTRINSMDDYNEALIQLTRAAEQIPGGPLPLAEWELVVFNGTDDVTGLTYQDT